MLPFVANIVDIIPQVVYIVNINTIKRLEHLLCYSRMDQEQHNNQSANEIIEEVSKLVFDKGVRKPINKREER